MTSHRAATVRRHLDHLLQHLEDFKNNYRRPRHNYRRPESLWIQASWQIRLEWFSGVIPIQLSQQGSLCVSCKMQHCAQVARWLMSLILLNVHWAASTLVKLLHELHFQVWDIRVVVFVPNVSELKCHTSCSMNVRVSSFFYVWFCMQDYLIDFGVVRGAIFCTLSYNVEPISILVTIHFV